MNRVGVVKVRRLRKGRRAEEVEEHLAESDTTNKLFCYCDQCLNELWLSADYGKCPLTGESLTMDDIVPIKTGKMGLSSNIGWFNLSMLVKFCVLNKAVLTTDHFCAAEVSARAFCEAIPIKNALRAIKVQVNHGQNIRRYKVTVVTKEPLRALMESVVIPTENPSIILEGEGRRTIICHWDHQSINNNATFTPTKFDSKWHYFQDDPSGFVFKGGAISGNGKVNLGRTWQQYSRVIFHITYFSDIVTRQGWVAWRVAGNENSTTYAEVDCKGPGADTSKHVPWMKKLSSSDLSTVS
ncbi:hypothetical protein V8G54_010140 [Vigna mungo]|uniref:pectinesterase n=1 Tax=Vigna mungo TaxID=3915 RepID=A0AAQ3NX07_VIGMU